MSFSSSILKSARCVDSDFHHLKKLLTTIKPIFLRNQFQSGDNVSRIGLSVYKNIKANISKSNKILSFEIIRFFCTFCKNLKDHQPKLASVVSQKYIKYSHKKFWPLSFGIDFNWDCSFTPDAHREKSIIGLQSYVSIHL